MGFEHTLLLVLGCVIVTLELWRLPKLLTVDFYRAFSAMFFLVYVVTPTVMLVRPIAADRGYLQFATTIDGILFSKVVGAALLLYVSSYLGYLGNRVLFLQRGVQAGLLNRLPDHLWLLIAWACAFIGMAGLMVYLRSGFGGSVLELIQFSGVRRIGLEMGAASFTFLNLAGLLQTASILMVAHGWTSSGPAKQRIWVFVGLALGAPALVALLLRGGRLYVMCFVLAFVYVLISRFRSNVAKWTTLVTGVCGVVLWILYGGVVFGRVEFTNTARLVSEAVDTLTANLYFPFASTGMAVTMVNAGVEPRYFQDILIGPMAATAPVVDRVAVRLSGELLLGNHIPPSVAQVNSELFLGPESQFTEIPVDIVAFGFYSFGFMGVGIVGFLFGGFLALLEHITATRRGALLGLRAQLIVFCATTLTLYSDPRSVLTDGYFIFIPLAMASIALSTQRLTPA